MLFVNTLERMVPPPLENTNRCWMVSLASLHRRQQAG
uniref:Uncharacterized protein n=1 Tax=Setaria italica TaxID=4555 RepID=K3ZG42_SETIT